jgi:hypothetical protein
LSFSSCFTTFIHAIRKDAKEKGTNQKSNGRVSAPGIPSIPNSSLPLPLAVKVLRYIIATFFFLDFHYRICKLTKEENSEGKREDGSFFISLPFLLLFAHRKRNEGGLTRAICKKCVMCVRALRVCLFVSLRVSLLSSCLFFLVFLFFKLILQWLGRLE